MENASRPSLGLFGAVLCAAVSLGFFVPRASAQIVNDGATNTINGTSVNLGTANLTVGGNGPNTVLVITNAGSLVSGIGYIGQNSTASNNMVKVTGSNSTWISSSFISVGESGSFNTLSIHDRARVANLWVTIGNNSNANNNAVTVSGPNSALNNSDTMRVGFYGSFNTLLVSNGGTVSNKITGYIGYRAGASNNQVTVTGTNSTWTTPGQLYIGVFGSSNDLRIAAGGTVSNTLGGIIGAQSSATHNKVSVDGDNSIWDTGSFLWVGDRGAFSKLFVGDGGRVISGPVLIGSAVSSSNNTVILTGSNSAWLIGDSLRIGLLSAFNELIMTNGGMVSNTTAEIGNGGNFNTVTVAGTNSTWNNSGSLSVGVTGSSNSLLLADGGAVTAGDVFVGVSSGSTGNRLTVSGGRLSATNFGGTSTLDIRRGGVVFNAGLIDVDRLVMNASQGLFEFNSGSFRARSANLNNAAFFTVGNGSSAATYYMSGAATNGHSFANNLRISTNATLTGNGTIVGNVTNFGRLDVGSSTGAINISGDFRFEPSATAIFELGGSTPTNGYDQLAVSAFVRFGGVLDLRLTNGFLPGPSDSFTLVKFATSFGIFQNAVNGQRMNFAGGKASFLVTYETNLVLSAVRYVDTDGDGQGDLQEQAAGTDPNDAASVLRILSITPNASGHQTVLFQSEPAKTYRVEYSSNLFSWPIATTNVSSAGATTQWTDDGTLTGGLPGPNRFYRVGLQ